MIKRLFIKLLFGHRRYIEKEQEKMIRIFLAPQFKDNTQNMMYKVYIDGRETDILLRHYEVIAILDKDQYRGFVYKNESIFLIPERKLLKTQSDPDPVDGRHIDSERFNIKNNGIIKKSVQTSSEG